MRGDSAWQCEFNLAHAHGGSPQPTINACAAVPVYVAHDVVGVFRGARCGDVSRANGERHLERKDSRVGKLSAKALRRLNLPVGLAFRAVRERVTEADPGAARWRRRP